MKVLVLQVRRPDDPMKLHEQQCFGRATGLPDEALRFVNLVDEVPTLADLDGYDALMVGGAGHYSVVEGNAAFFGPLGELLGGIVETGFPTFASCYGFQAMVSALGGSVIHDSDNGEVGSYQVSLTEAGRTDELFSHLPNTFIAQMGHKDRADRMPDGLPNLAATDRSPLQALRVPDKPIWATQFHPELDQQTNRERYLAYIERYHPEDMGGQEFRSLPSPEVSTLLPAFLELIRGGKNG